MSLFTEEVKEMKVNNPFGNELVKAHTDEFYVLSGMIANLYENKYYGYTNKQLFCDIIVPEINTAMDNMSQEIKAYLIEFYDRSLEVKIEGIVRIFNKHIKMKFKIENHNDIKSDEDESYPMSGPLSEQKEFDLKDILFLRLFYSIAMIMDYRKNFIKMDGVDAAKSIIKYFIFESKESKFYQSFRYLKPYKSV
jgi:hypothetical protein